MRMHVICSVCPESVRITLPVMMSRICQGGQSALDVVDCLSEVSKPESMLMVFVMWLLIALTSHEIDSQSEEEK